MVCDTDTVSAGSRSSSAFTSEVLPAPDGAEITNSPPLRELCFPGVMTVFCGTRPYCSELGLFGVYQYCTGLDKYSLWPPNCQAVHLRKRKECTGTGQGC